MNPSTYKSIIDSKIYVNDVWDNVGHLYGGIIQFSSDCIEDYCLFYIFYCETSLDLFDYSQNKYGD